MKESIFLTKVLIGCPKPSPIKLVKAYLNTLNKTHEILYFRIYMTKKCTEKCEADCANEEEFAVNQARANRAAELWIQGCSHTGRNLSLASAQIWPVSTQNLIKPIMCCSCRRISRELTILRTQYVGNAFDQGFTKEAVALMILLTFPGDCKDSSGNNQISMSFLSFGCVAYRRLYQRLERRRHGVSVFLLLLLLLLMNRNVFI